MVLGDFNFNLLIKSNSFLQDMISEFTLINTELTHLSGCLLGCVHLGKHVFQKCYLEAMQISSLHFSGNEAVKFKLRLLWEVTLLLLSFNILFDRSSVKLVA